MKSHALCCRCVTAKIEDLGCMSSLLQAVSVSYAAAAAAADLIVVGMGFHHRGWYELAAQAGHGRCQQPAGLHAVSCMPAGTLLTCLKHHSEE